MSKINLLNWEIVDDVQNSRIVIRSKATGEQLQLNESGVFTSSSAIDADTVDGIEASKIFDKTGDTLSGTLNMASNKIVGLDAPTQDNEAARKAYVDATAEGLNIKEAVRVCTCGQGNVDLSSSSDPNPIDTVTLDDGDRILLIEQTDATENGIYETVDADDPTTWVRTTDANDNIDVNSGMFVLAVEGSESGNVGFVLITPDPIDVGVTPLNFTRFSGAEAIEAGDNISRTGSRLDVVDGSGSGLDADTVDGIEGSELGSDVSNDGVTVTNSSTDLNFTNNITAIDDGDGTSTISVDSTAEKVDGPDGDAHFAGSLPRFSDTAAGLSNTSEGDMFYSNTDKSVFLNDGT